MMRKATFQDIPMLISLTRACAKHMINNGIYQWNDHYPSAQAFEKDVERQELYINENEGRIMGCIVISDFMDAVYEPVQWLTPSGANTYIHRLAVHPDHQKKGIARAMMDYAEEKARQDGHISVRLDTFSKNQRNQRFYLNRGYQQLEDIFFPEKSSHPFHCYELVL